MGLFDSVLRLIENFEFKLDKFCNFLIDSIEQNIWQKENNSVECESSFGNFMTACKILIRLFLKKILDLENEIEKEKAINLIKVKKIF